MHNVALPILLLLPLIGAIVVFALPKEEVRLVKGVTLGVSLVVFVYTVALALAFDTKGDRFQFAGSWPWIKLLGTRLAFGADGIAVVLLVMTALLVPAVEMRQVLDALYASCNVRAMASAVPAATE